MRTRIAALAGIAGFAPVAGAQPVGTATYSISFNGGGNNIALAVGQTASVAVLVSFSPGMNTAITSGTLSGNVIGLSDGAFSLTGSGSGAVAWSNPAIPPPFNFLGTNPGTPSGSSVNGVIFGYGFLFPPGPYPVPGNPVTVWTGTVTGNGFQFGIINLNFTGLGPTGVFAGAGWNNGSGSTFPFVAPYTSNPGLGGTIFYVPAPGALAPLALAGLVATRRRR